MSYIVGFSHLWEAGIVSTNAEEAHLANSTQHWDIDWDFLDCSGLFLEELSLCTMNKVFTTRCGCGLLTAFIVMVMQTWVRIQRRYLQDWWTLPDLMTHLTWGSVQLLYANLVCMRSLSVQQSLCMLLGRGIFCFRFNRRNRFGIMAQGYLLFWVQSAGLTSHTKARQLSSYDHMKLQSGVSSIRFRLTNEICHVSVVMLASHIMQQSQLAEVQFLHNKDE